MLSLDLFDSRFEKRLQEGSVDNLEARRIDDLNMRMLDLLDRAKEPAYKKNPAALAGLKKQFQTIKAERDSYFKINPATGMNADQTLGTVKGALDEGSMKDMLWDLSDRMDRDQFIDYTTSELGQDADEMAQFWDNIHGPLDEGGIPGNVPTEKIPGKEDLLKGKGRSYYEDQKKSSDEVAQDQRLHVGDPVVVTAPNEFEGKTGEISEFSPSGKFVVVNLYNHGEHSMHLSDVEYNKYADEEVDEGWSDRALAQRTGQPRTPYSVYIKGRKWKDFENEDHARAVMDKLKAKFKSPDSGLDPETITIAPTDVSEAISKKDLVGRLQKDLPKVTDPKNKNAQSVAWTGPGKEDYGYTGYQGHGMPTERQERDRLRADKKKGVAEMDKSQPSQERHGNRPLGAKGTTAKPVAARKVVKDLSMDFDQAFAKQKPVKKKGVAEGLGDTLKSVWREIKTYVVDFVANAVGLPDDQRREVFVKAGNTFSNEVIKLLANHPARDKLIPMVREIGGYMAKARTLKELNSLMDKAELFLADVDAGKFDPPVAKTLPGHRDNQGVAETVTDVRSLWAKAYHKLAPRIERHRDSFLAGQLYDELENIAELHGAEREFKQMMSTARGRAHMEYDTNPGGFQNWFWFLPFEDEGVAESKQKGVDGKACWKGYKRMGTKQKGGKTVDNCVKMGEDRVSEDYNDSSDAVERAILNRIMVAHTDLLKQFGPQKVMQAAEEVAYDVGDVDEIGTSDVSAYVNQVKQILGAV